LHPEGWKADQPVEAFPLMRMEARMAVNPRSAALRKVEAQARRHGADPGSSFSAPI
jgi:hypothetical protein